MHELLYHQPLLVVPYPPWRLDSEIHVDSELFCPAARDRFESFRDRRRIRVRRALLGYGKEIEVVGQPTFGNRHSLNFTLYAFNFTLSRSAFAACIATAEDHAPKTRDGKRRDFGADPCDRLLDELFQLRAFSCHVASHQPTLPCERPRRKCHSLRSHPKPGSMRLASPGSSMSM